MNITRKYLLNVKTIRAILAELAKLAGLTYSPDLVTIEIAVARHRRPTTLPSGKMAIYMFFHRGICLKVGRAYANSKARYVSHHYDPKSSRSNLAKSILKHRYDYEFIPSGSAHIGKWIENNMDRINILLLDDLGTYYLSLVEAFFQCYLQPRYEGFKKQKKYPPGPIRVAVLKKTRRSIEQG